MLQSTSEYEERSFDDIQRALDIEHTVKALEAQLELHTSTDYLLTGTGPANDFAKEQLLSAIEVLSSVSKLI